MCQHVLKCMYEYVIVLVRVCVRVRTLLLVVWISSPAFRTAASALKAMKLEQPPKQAADPKNAKPSGLLPANFQVRPLPQAQLFVASGADPIWGSGRSTTEGSRPWCMPSSWRLLLSRAQDAKMTMLLHPTRSTSTERKGGQAVAPLSRSSPCHE